MMVDSYLLLAGVSRKQLPHLIDGFLRQEAAFGSPPTESTVLLNRWEDDSLYFIPDGIRVLKRGILWDETAWHAALFARIRNAPNTFEPRIEFEEIFKEELDKRLREGPGTGPSRDVAAPKPRLAWTSYGLVLRLPRSEGRMEVWLDESERPLRLRGSEDWPLPQPWPKRFRWKIAETEGRFELLEHEGFVVFDKTTDHLVREIGPKDFHSSADGSREIELDTTDAVILSRQPFQIDGEDALEPEAGSFVGFAKLGNRTASLELGGFQVDLKVRPRRRLSLVEDEISGGPRGALHGPSATLRIETGLGRSESRAVRITIGEEARLFRSEITEDGYGEIGMEEILAGFEGAGLADPARVRAELMAPGENDDELHASGIVNSGWVWPGFRNSDGYVYRSERSPGNLVEDKCLHSGRDDEGSLCLDPGGGYEAARAVFEIESVHVPFDLPWPDVSVLRLRSEGGISRLPLGSRLSIGEDDRFDTIRIRCPDPKAELIVRGRHEPRPFAGGLARRLSMRDLLEPAEDPRVLLRRDSGAEVFLFELAVSLAPRNISFPPVRDTIVLKLRFDELIDAVAADVEDETGETRFAEASLGSRPVETIRPEWFDAEISDQDPQEIDVKFHAGSTGNGAKLARLLVRPAGSDRWQLLRDGLGGTLAVALTGKSGEPPEERSIRFETLSRWLSDRYEDECRMQIEKVLAPRWDGLGRKLLDMPDWERTLLRASVLPPPDHAPPGWVPVHHPMLCAPNLYAAPRRAFAQLAASDMPGISELAALAEFNTGRMRELQQLHPTVYLAFSNVLDASRDPNIPLQGFKPELFFQHLAAPDIDIDPSVGWFWRGSPLLGPDHWRAAHLRLIENFDAAGLFGDDAHGPNSDRQLPMQKLMHAAWDSTRENLRPPAPRRNPKAEEPEAVDVWSSALLSGFAQASRFGEVDDYVGSLSRQVGISAYKARLSIAFMLRLAPELFAFHLLLWEIAKERP